MYGNYGKQLVLNFHHGSICNALRTLSPIILGNPELSPLVCNETSNRDAWDNFHFGVRANYYLPWDPIFLLQPFWNALYLEWNIERRGLLLMQHILPPDTSGHIWQCCLPQDNTYGTHNQDKFLKLPTSLCSRPDKYALFSAGIVICLCLLTALSASSSACLEDMAYREAPTKLTHKT